MTLKSGTNLFLSRRAARCFFFREALRQLGAKRQGGRTNPPRRPRYGKGLRLARVKNMCGEYRDCWIRYP